MKHRFEEQFSPWIACLAFVAIHFPLRAKAEEKITPVGVSIDLAITEEWGPGKPMIRLHNHTDHTISYLSHGISGAWRVRVFNKEGTEIGSAGMELFKSGSSATKQIKPGESGTMLLDIRWGVLKDKDIPPQCRVEIETPPFIGEEDALTSAKIVVPMKLLEEPAPAKPLRE